MAEKPRLDPLRNVGTSRVLYALVAGPKTPTELSKPLRVAPPGVMQQLHRLERIGVVRRGEKRGKSQYYEIDWAGVNKLALEKLEGQIHWALGWGWELREKRKLGRDEIENIRDVMERLSKNENFVKLVHEYFRVLAPRGLKERIRASAAFGTFPDVTWFAKRLKRGRTKEAHECLALFKRIHGWLGPSHEIATMDALMEAMERAGLR